MSTLKLLSSLQTTQSSLFVWSARSFLYHNLPLNEVYARNGINILLSTTCHYVELVLKSEQPLIFSAFRMSGLAPSQICLHWLKQCFLNYLDWPNIIAFVAICLVCGIDYQTYFCVAVLKHLNTNQSIVQHHTNKDLQFYLRVRERGDFLVWGAMTGFKFFIH